MQELDPGRKERRVRQRLAKIKTEKSVNKVKRQDSRNVSSGFIDDSMHDVVGGSTNGIAEHVSDFDKHMGTPAHKQTNTINRDETETNHNDRYNLPIPYEFLNRPNSPLHTIVVPHFTWKSINFFLSVISLVMFIGLLITYLSQEQTANSWGCLMFKAQNKFYPRLRYNYEVWRIIVSALFHGSISHLVLNIIGLQVYGYFVEWYYGKLKYSLALTASLLCSHLLSCLTNVVSVSSTSSGILYTILGLKIGFFIKYRHFPLLQGRRASLYGLFALIFGINIIVLFVGSNADVGAHIAGLIIGLLFAGIFYEYQKESDQKIKAFKYTLMFVTVAFVTILIGVTFGLNTEFMSQLNKAIDTLC